MEAGLTFLSVNSLNKSFTQNVARLEDNTPTVLGKKRWRCRQIPWTWMFSAIKAAPSQLAFWLRSLDFYSSHVDHAHSYTSSVRPHNFSRVWSNSHLMNLLIFLAWHSDTSPISASKISQFVLIPSGIWLQGKQLGLQRCSVIFKPCAAIFLF